MRGRAMTGRMALATLVILLVVMTPIPAGPQPPAKARIGWVGSAPLAVMPIFRQALRERGWVEGENLVIEERYAEGGDLAGIPGLVADLVKLRVDVLVTSGATATGAAQKATRTVPVVFLTADPVERGYVASLARPGGNPTGVAGVGGEGNIKRLEILRQTFPRVTRVGVLYRPSPTQRRWLGEMEPAARVLGLRLVPVEIGSAEAVDRASSVLVRERVNALTVLPAPFFAAEKERLFRLAAKLRLPAIYDGRGFVEAGGLMSYGGDSRDAIRRAAAHVDRILRGAKPAEIPVEQATKIELVLNETTAKTLGVTFPQPILNRADEVIK